MTKGKALRQTQGDTVKPCEWAEVWEYFKAGYLRPEAPPATVVYGRLRRAAAANGWAVPSLSTVRRKIKTDIPPGVLKRRRGVWRRRPVKGAMACALDEQTKTGSHQGGLASRQFTPHPNAGGAHHSPGKLKGE